MATLFHTLREEHNDLFQSSDGSTYTPTFSLTSIDAASEGVPGTKSSVVFDFGVDDPFEITKAMLSLGVKVAATGNATTATLRVTVSSSADGSTYATDYVSGDYKVADLVAGKVLYQGFLPETTQRYVKVTLSNYGATKFTAGTLFGYIAPQVD